MGKKKKMNDTLKEAIQIVLFLLGVAILLLTFVIYPLHLTKALMGRIDIDSFDKDSLPLNDASAYVHAGLVVDTFYFDADGMNKLAALYLYPAVNPDSVVGTAILVPSEKMNRDSVIEFAALLRDSGFAVISYDQRATGRSGGKYHSDGADEAIDLEELISHLDMRQRLKPPVTVIGWSLGADAALIASQEESRINAVVAISPVLTTERLIEQLREKNDSYWMPFYHSLFWYWYGLRSSYAGEKRTVEDILPVKVKTLLVAPDDFFDSPEYEKLIELSDKSKLETAPTADIKKLLYERLVSFSAHR